MCIYGYGRLVMNKGLEKFLGICIIVIVIFFVGFYIGFYIGD